MRSAHPATTPVVGLVTEIISPYRIPVFNALNELLQGRLHVFFLSVSAGRSWAVRYEDIDFAYSVLPSRAVPLGADTQLGYVNAPVALRSENGVIGPVIVGGYNHLQYVWSLARARRLGQRLVLWSESADPIPAPRRPRDQVKRLLVSAATDWVAPGEAAARRLAQLGASPGRTHIAPNAVDVSFWHVHEGDPIARRGALRVLFVGQLVDRKGLDILLAAVAGPQSNSITLDVAGEGSDAPRLQAMAADLGVTVDWHQSLDRDALRALYADSDVVVLPSRSDPWGLVLNEAMVAGCAVVASSSAGAVGDLVIDGRTGLVFPSEDVEALRRCLLRLAVDANLLQDLRTAGQSHAVTFTPERCAMGLAQSVGAMSD